MKARRIAPDSVQVEIRHAEQKNVHHDTNDRAKAPSERLLNESSKQNLFPNRIEEDRRQRIQREKARRGHQATHLVQVQISANAHAPVIRRVSVNNHSQAKESECTCDTGQHAQKNCQRRTRFGHKAYLAAAFRCQHHKRQRPQSERLQKEKLLQRVRAEECNEANDHHCRIHNQRNQPRRADDARPERLHHGSLQRHCRRQRFHQGRPPPGMGLPMFQNELVL